jgi:hypothetical protein
VNMHIRVFQTGLNEQNWYFLDNGDNDFHWISVIQRHHLPKQSFIRGTFCKITVRPLANMRKHMQFEEFCLLGCNALQSSESQPNFRSNMSHVPSGLKRSKTAVWSRQQAELTFFRNVGWLSPDNAVSYRRRELFKTIIVRTSDPAYVQCICTKKDKRAHLNFFSYLATKKLNCVAFSPHANYTDRATAACQRS